MTADHVDQAVRHLRRDGIPVRPSQSGMTESVIGKLDDGTPVVRVGSILDGNRGMVPSYLKCVLVGHRFDGRRIMQWADEETPAIECFRCGLVRARKPTGGFVNESEAGGVPDR